MKKVGKTTRPFRYELNQIPYDYTVEVTTRFKGLDLIECLKNYGRRFVTLYRRQGSRPSPRKRNAKSENGCLKALQIAEKKREAKGKGEKERYTHLNAEFQRIARTEKNAFLNDQCKEIVENNRMGKTRGLLKREIPRERFMQMGTIKDRNGMNLTETKDIKKRWQEYTEELHKKDLNDPDNHDGVVTHLEPDILECEVKWTLGSITMNKASGGHGILAELFQILKDDAVKVLCSVQFSHSVESDSL